MTLIDVVRRLWARPEPTRRVRSPRLGMEVLEGREVPAILYDGTTILTSMDGSLSLTTRVVDDNPTYPGKYFWEYTVTNLSYGYADAPGADAIDLNGFFRVSIPTLGGPIDNISHRYADHGFGDPSSVAWETDWFYYGDVARYWFTTPPLPIVDGTASYYDSGTYKFGHDSTATGAVKGPGRPNRPPVANPDTATVFAGTINFVGTETRVADDTVSVSPAGPSTISVLSNDMDPDGDALTVISASGARHGTLSVQGNAVVYTPTDPTWDFRDSFTYTISDPYGLQSSASVTVTLDADLAADVRALGETIEAEVAIDSDSFPSYGEEEPPSPPTPPEFTAANAPPGGAPAVPQAPTGWNDFKPVAVAPAWARLPDGTIADAATAWNYQLPDYTVKSGGQIRKGVAKATAVATLDNKNFEVIFDAERSFRMANKNLSQNLLNHELLHFKVAQYVAEKARLNCPDMVGKGAAENTDAKQAVQDAEAAAEADLKKQVDDFAKVWRSMDDAARLYYDQQTNYSRNPDEQVRWQTDEYWKPKIDAELKKLGWAK